MSTQRHGTAFAAGLVAALAFAAQPAPLLAQQAVAPPSLALVSIVERPPVKVDTTEVLPFARNPLPATFPSVGVALGYGTYLADLATVERAFHAMEDYYRSAGYPVSEAAAVDLGPMLLWTLRVRPTPWLDLALQAGRAGESVDELNLVGGLVSGLYTPPSARFFSLFAGVGAGSYGFSFTRGYGARITPNDPNGGYYVLDQLTLEGGETYWTGAGGFTIRAGSYGAFEALVQYFGMREVTTTTRAGEVWLNLSGAMIGASFTVFF